MKPTKQIWTQVYGQTSYALYLYINQFCECEVTYVINLFLMIKTETKGKQQVHGKGKLLEEIMQ